MAQITGSDLPNLTELANIAITTYPQFDARLADQVNKPWGVSLIGRSRLDAQQSEYDSALTRRLTELQRSINLIYQ